MKYPPEADQNPDGWMNWKPAPVGTPQEVDEYLDYLAQEWAKEE
jgi:hypothetical protein